MFLVLALLGACASSGGSGADHVNTTVTAVVASTTTESASALRPAAPATRCSSEPWQGELVVWHPFTLTAGDVFGELLDQWNQQHPTTPVRAQAIPGYRELLRELRSSTAADGPDLVVAGVSATRALTDSGVTLAPWECPDDEPGDDVTTDLMPVVAATYTVDGELVATPYNVSTPVLIYDRARVHVAGLDPDRPPTTPAELREMLEAVVALGDGGRGLAMYDTATSWLIEQWAAQEGRLLAIPANGTEGGEVARFQFETPEVVEALTWLQDLNRDGLVAWFGLNSSGFDNLLGMVGEAPAVATFHTSASLGDVLRLAEERVFGELDVGVGPLPGPGRGGLVGGGALWVIDRQNPARSGAAHDLSEWLMDPARLARFAAATGYVPPRASAVDEPVLVQAWADRPQLRVAYDQLAGLAGDPAQIGLQVGPRQEIQRVLEIAASLTVTGEVDPADELRKAETLATGLMEEYRRSLGP